jgi:hypothetical protein
MLAAPVPERSVLETGRFCLWEDPSVGPDVGIGAVGFGAEGVTDP